MASLNGTASASLQESDSDSSSSEYAPHCPAALELYSVAPEAVWSAVSEFEDLQASEAASSTFQSTLSYDRLREEATASLTEGVMPPWEQEGVMKDVAGVDLKTLVTADFVYNKELR